MCVKERVIITHAPTAAAAAGYCFHRCLSVFSDLVAKTDAAIGS